jgi:hypothetical protein
MVLSGHCSKNFIQSPKKVRNLKNLMETGTGMNVEINTRRKQLIPLGKIKVSGTHDL